MEHKFIILRVSKYVNQPVPFCQSKTHSQCDPFSIASILIETTDNPIHFNQLRIPVKQQSTPPKQ